MTKFRWRMLSAGLALAVIVALGIYGTRETPAKRVDTSPVRVEDHTRYTPTPVEWASLSVAQVAERRFRTEHVTEGKIAVDDDRATPVFSPYAGRIIKLLARPGDEVVQGQPLFVVEAADNVQAQNDFIAALTALNKARSQLELAQIQDRRAQDLFAGKAIPLKDVQQAQAGLVSAQNDLQSSQVGLEAVRNRLRMLGLNDDAIAAFQDKGHISADTVISAPISGTIVQRKAGPGQYVMAGSSDPVFLIGDLSTVWLTAFVRETEAADIEVGQDVTFAVLAYPGRLFKARTNYVATSIDPVTRRLLVRATIDNAGHFLKPEMFASVTLYSGGDRVAAAVPKSALIHEGDRVRVWVVNGDNSIALREIETGLSNGDVVEARRNLAVGEKIVTRGSLFIDRVASGS
jgi:membrane fusion protein, heavy metal efflux system